MESRELLTEGMEGCLFVEHLCCLTVYLARRFRDFSKLHDRIASLAKNHQDFPKLPSLPGKKIKLFTDHFSEEFIETRRSALEQYLMLMSQVTRFYLCSKLYRGESVSIADASKSVAR